MQQGNNCENAGTALVETNVDPYEESSAHTRETIGSGTVCALDVACAASKHLLLLACRSTLASLLRCLLVSLGDLSAEIVEGRFRC
jgi:hypothetical protein